MIRSNLITNFSNLLIDEFGASMPEYAVLVGLIAVIVAVSATALGGSVNQRIGVVAGKLDTH